MSYYKDLNILIIYGGRDDGVISNGQQSSLMNDIMLLNLEHMEWIRAEVTGFRFKPRCAHTSIIIESKMIIFGGFTEKSYLDSDLLVVELDQNNAYKLQKESENSPDQAAQKHIVQVEEIFKLNNDIYGFHNLPQSVKVVRTDNQDRYNSLNMKSGQHALADVINIRTYMPFPSLVSQQSQLNMQRKKTVIQKADCHNTSQQSNQKQGQEKLATQTDLEPVETATKQVVKTEM